MTFCFAVVALASPMMAQTEKKEKKLTPVQKRIRAELKAEFVFPNRVESSFAAWMVYCQYKPGEFNRIAIAADGGMAVGGGMLKIIPYAKDPNGNPMAIVATTDNRFRYYCVGPDGKVSSDDIVGPLMTEVQLKRWAFARVGLSDLPESDGDDLLEEMKRRRDRLDEQIKQREGK